MKLSILILTSQKTQNNFNQLIGLLMPQTIPFEGNIHVDIEAGVKMNFGQKCNSLLKGAEGEYIWFLKDTALISETAVQDVFNAIAFNPDVIGVTGSLNVNGYVKDWTKGVCFNSPMKKSVCLKFKNKVGAEEIWEEEMSKKNFESVYFIEKPIVRNNIGLRIVK